MKTIYSRNFRVRYKKDNSIVTELLSADSYDDLLDTLSARNINSIFKIEDITDEAYYEESTYPCFMDRKHSKGLLAAMVVIGAFITFSALLVIGLWQMLKHL